MRLSNYEKETIITFNEEESEAVIYTLNKSLIGKLDKAKIKSSKSELGAKTYKVPKEWIKVETT